MQPTPQHPRIDVTDLKFQIGKKIGHERAQLYFSYLRRFLGQKLSKNEFNKLCLITLGRDNIQLHNKFIRSILQNACQSKVPPLPLYEKVVSQSTVEAENNSVLAEDGFFPSASVASSTPIWSNGDIPSPRKSRGKIRESKLRDMAGSLGPNGTICHQSQVSSYISVVKENGSLAPCDSKRQMIYDKAGNVEHPSKRRLIEKPLREDYFAIYGSGPTGDIAMEDGEEVENTQKMISNRGPLQAPLGIPFCSASVGSSCRPLSLTVGATSGSFPAYCDSGELSHTEGLKMRMEQIAASCGLGGVTMDAANSLNNALDSYLKLLIKSSVDLRGARSRQEITRHPVTKHHPPGKIVNGTLPGNHINVQGRHSSLEDSQDPKCHHLVSLLDFKVAMELNPQQLGENRPLLLEKICLNSFKE